MKRQTRVAPSSDEPSVEVERGTLLARLVGGAIHELNNPLSVLLGQVTLFKRALAGNPALVERADRIGGAADRCARIVRSLVALSEPPGEAGRVDLDRLVRETLELLAHGLRSRSITVKFDPGAPLAAWADPRGLRELLAHLILSVEPALEEAPPPRLVEVKTGLASEPGTLELKITVSGGLGWRLGKPTEAELTRLDVSEVLAEEVGGRFEADTSETRTHIRTAWIPAAPEPLPTPPSSRGERKVLVVPGAEEFGLYVSEVLAAEGHLCTPSEKEGETHGGPFDLVVLDADQAGLELVEWIGEYEDRLVVVAGDALPGQVARLLRQAGVEVLRKPLDPEDLSQAVARALP